MCGFGSRRKETEEKNRRNSRHDYIDYGEYEGFQFSLQSQTITVIALIPKSLIILDSILPGEGEKVSAGKSANLPLAPLLMHNMFYTMLRTENPWWFRRSSRTNPLHCLPPESQQRLPTFLCRIHHSSTYSSHCSPLFSRNEQARGNHSCEWQTPTFGP